MVITIITTKRGVKSGDNEEFRPLTLIKKPAVRRPQKIFNITLIVIIRASFILTNGLASYKFIEFLPTLLADDFYYFGFVQTKHLHITNYSKKPKQLNK